jgi:transposase
MNEEELKARILHLRQVEKLSHRQIAAVLNIGRERVGQILGNTGCAKIMLKDSVVDKYAGLIARWYQQYPKLQGRQIYERLQSYGYQGSYVTIARMTREYRQTKPRAYHPLIFLPGEEAQVDWFFFRHEKIGYVAGFVYVLSYSRYAWGIFYPKTSFEFFLSGHMECFKHIGGLAHCHRYDNLKSVVIKREPQIEYNAQFLDFASFYGFKLHACNPYSGNEKDQAAYCTSLGRLGVSLVN